MTEVEAIEYEKEIRETIAGWKRIIRDGGYPAGVVEQAKTEVAWLLHRLEEMEGGKRNGTETAST